MWVWDHISCAAHPQTWWLHWECAMSSLVNLQYLGMPLAEMGPPVLGDAPCRNGMLLVIGGTLATLIRDILIKTCKIKVTENVIFFF